MDEAEPPGRDEDQDKILYDLLQCYEWPETTSVLVSSLKRCETNHIVINTLSFMGGR